MKLLITGAWSYKNQQIEEIKKLGHEIDFLQYEKDAVENPERYDGVICNGLFLHHDIKEFSNLKYIQLTSAGFDRVPMEYTNEKKIAVYNARGVYSIPMAEFAISGVLQLYKKSRFFYKNQELKKWEKHRDLTELFGKTVCVVGCGNVGTECAKRFSAFGCKVLGVDLFPNDNAQFEKIYPLSQKDEILAKSDIVILTLPLTDETRYMFNKECFSNFKDGAVLVNIARGGVIDTKALCDALNNKLFGAVLDVFEEEPLKENDSLWDMDNVILTPHNSFVGEGNADRLFGVIYENLRKWN